MITPACNPSVDKPSTITLSRDTFRGRCFHLQTHPRPRVPCVSPKRYSQGRAHALQTPSPSTRISSIKTRKSSEFSLIYASSLSRKPPKTSENFENRSSQRTFSSPSPRNQANVPTHPPQASLLQKSTIRMYQKLEKFASTPSRRTGSPSLAFSTSSPSFVAYSSTPTPSLHSTRRLASNCLKATWSMLAEPGF